MSIVAERVVRRLFEDDEPLDWAPDPADPDEAGPASLSSVTNVAREELDILNEREYHLGFSIDTGHEAWIKDNLHDIGMEPTLELWEQLNRDIIRLELNAQKIFVAHGLVFRAEGHSDNALVGSLWVRYEDHANFALIKRILGTGEPWSTGNGYITDLKGSEHLYDGISDVGRRVLDVSIYIYADDEVKAEIEEL